MASKEALFKINGCSNHCDTEREINDFYATDPEAVELLLEREKFSNNILEPCAGLGHISETLKKAGYNVFTRDLIQRDYKLDEVGDFFNYSTAFDGDIITNPPYSMALDFLKHSYDLIKPGQKVALFLKLTFLEGAERYTFFNENPPKYVYVFSNRIACAKNGEFIKDGKKIGSAVAYAWYIFEKGYTGEPTIRWLSKSKSNISFVKLF